MAKRCHTIPPTDLPESQRQRVIGLARLLTYAMTDAEELHAARCATIIGEAITELKLNYGLSDGELLPVAGPDLH